MLYESSSSIGHDLKWKKASKPWKLFFSYIFLFLPTPPFSLKVSVLFSLLCHGGRRKRLLASLFGVIVTSERAKFGISWGRRPMSAKCVSHWSSRWRPDVQSFSSGLFGLWCLLLRRRHHCGFWLPKLGSKRESLRWKLISLDARQTAFD